MRCDDLIIWTAALLEVRNFLLLTYSKRVVFLSEIGNGNGDERDKHLARRRIPTETLHA